MVGPTRTPATTDDVPRIQCEAEDAMGAAASDTAAALLVHGRGTDEESSPYIFSIVHRAVKTAEVRIIKFSPYGIAPSLWFLRSKFHPKILEGSTDRGRQTKDGWVKSAVFTARCTLSLVQSALLRLHVVCLSVCPSVCL